MDNADEITNLLAQITREEATLTKFSMVKETLQNEVEAKKGELQIAQGVKRKQQVEYTETNKAQKKGYHNNTHCAGMSIKRPRNKHGIDKFIN